MDGERRILQGVEHGKRSSFQKGCGCEPCVEANRTYARDWAREKRGFPRKIGRPKKKG